VTSRVIRLSVVAAALAAALAPIDAVRVERWYSTGIYPQIQGVITPLTNRIPVALLDISVAVGLIVISVVLRRRSRALGIRRALLRTTGSVLWSAAAGYLLFLFLWGLNYRRLSLESKLDYNRARVTLDAAVVLANAAATSANEGFAAAHAQAWDGESLKRSFADVQQSLGARQGAVPGVPKRSLLSFYFRRAAIDGMTDPFFLEIILNTDLLVIERPFVIAHEWAHLAGYADESEANFVAWLTCLRGDALARYSGSLAAYEHAAGALPRGGRGGLVPLGPGPRSDLRAMAKRYERSSPVVRQAAHDVYDGYLRANRVQEGIGSYDAVLRLMLGTRFGPDRTPLRR
jgi:hypothetical protein